MANQGLNTGINTTVPQVNYLSTNNVNPNQILNNPYQGGGNTVNANGGWAGLQLFNPFNWSIFGGNTTFNGRGKGATTYDEIIKASSGGSFSDFETNALNTLQANGVDTSNIRAYQNNGKFGLVDDTTGKDLTGTAYEYNKDATLTGTQGTWGSLLGATQNLLNLGNSGWGLYANVQNFKQNKELASKQKELLEQQIQSNKDNMAYLKLERERQDTQRRNVAAQRTSESSIRNF